jgi:hypothetical protein
MVNIIRLKRNLLLLRNFEFRNSADRLKTS